MVTLITFWSKWSLYAGHFWWAELAMRDEPTIGLRCSVRAHPRLSRPAVSSWSVACPLLRPVTFFLTLLLPPFLFLQLSFCLFCPFCTMHVCTSNLGPRSCELRWKKPCRVLVHFNSRTVVKEVEIRWGVCNNPLAEWTCPENGWRSSVWPILHHGFYTMQQWVGGHGGLLWSSWLKPE